jgi:dihydrofolate reductase
MRKVIVCNITSLDGYYEGPGGNVMALPMDEAFDAYNLERMRSAGTVLLGRVSYEGFSSYWPHIADHPQEPEDYRAVSPGNRELSRIYNGVEKVVVTDGYTPAADNPWHGTTTVLRRDEVASWITAQRSGSGGDILIYGSHIMWNALLHAGLVDELHLMVGAVVLGGGTPLFTTPVADLRLLDARCFDGSHNVLLTYAAR